LQITPSGRPCDQGDTVSYTGMAAAGDRFVLQSRVGVGGMCEVLSAVDLRRIEYGDLRPVVALKRLLPEFVHQRRAQTALAREYFTLRHLVHPGIVRVFDLHREEWGLCFSMELLEGASVHAVLGTHPTGLGRAGITLGARVFESLAYLHSQGVAHGDIKPANIFLKQDRRIALLDFNVARASDRPGTAGSKVARGLTGNASLSGLSLLHAAPERLKGAVPAPPGDVFSASCTAYEMITGHHPFRMLTAQEAAASGLRPEKPSAMSRRQWRELRRGLSFDPQARPTARQLSAVLRDHGWLAKIRRVLSGSGAGK
jgi:serine/threonine-protein kinase Stk1